MDTKKLRQKILDLAIRGKLVPQDPNDEPASVLLERIRAEKEQLIKEGKIKRSKKSAATDKSHYENVPFEIPENWCWVTGNDIFNAMISCKPQGDEFKYIDIDSIDNKNHRIISPKILKVKNAPSRASRYTQPGDVLFSMVRPYLKNIALVEESSCIASTGFFVCSPMQLLTSEYCYYMMLSDYVIYGLNQYMKGDNSPSINNGHITSWLYPIPPINEQLRISAEIKKWFVFIDDLERGKIELESLIKQVKSKIIDLAISGKLVPQDPEDEPSIELLKRINPNFQSCDNSHYENLPKNWCLAKVKDVFVINPRNKAEDNIIAGFIPMTLIDDGYSNTFSYETRTWGSIKTGFTHFANGDVAVAKISPCLENRKSIVLRDLPNGIGAGTTELHVFRSSVVVPEYALYFFKSEYFISKCVGTFNGVVGQQRVGKNIIEEIQIPIPPINEQTKIVSTIETIFTQLNTITAEL